MKKEQILDKLKYIVRTICYKHSDKDFDIKTFVVSQNLDDLFRAFDFLSTAEKIWLQTEYEVWLNTDMKKYEDIIKDVFDLKKIVGV